MKKKLLNIPVEEFQKQDKDYLEDYGYLVDDLSACKTVFDCELLLNWTKLGIQMTFWRLWDYIRGYRRYYLLEKDGFKYIYDSEEQPLKKRGKKLYLYTSPYEKEYIGKIIKKSNNIYKLEA